MKIQSPARLAAAAAPLAFALLFQALLFSPSAQAAGVVNASDITFHSRVLVSKVPVLVDFWAPWCLPCRAQEAPLAAAAASLGDKARIVRVNIDHNPFHARHYKVQALPTTLVFINGELVDRATGVLSAEEIRDLLVRTATDSTAAATAGAGSATVAAAPGGR